MTDKEKLAAATDWGCYDVTTERLKELRSIATKDHRTLGRIRDHYGPRPGLPAVYELGDARVVIMNTIAVLDFVIAERESEA